MFDSAAQLEQFPAHPAEQQPSPFHNELSQIDRENADMNRVHQLRDKADKQGAPLSGADALEFSSKNLFPGDLRGQELVLKMFQHIELTPREQGELQGRFEFKGNPRGQELVQKSYVETMTADEEKELQALRQKKYGNSSVASEASPHSNKAEPLNLSEIKTNEQYFLELSQQKFPDDPRARELYIKELDGRITDEERKELAVVDAKTLYPEDPRAQELHVRGKTQDFDQSEYNELNIRRAYPGSEELIQLELTALSRDLTDAESARRNALYSEFNASKEFPDDFRMQNLVIRFDRGDLSRAERIELSTERARKDALLVSDNPAEQDEYIRQRIRDLNEMLDADEKLQKKGNDPFNSFKP